MKTIDEEAKKYSFNLIPDENGMSFPLERKEIQDAYKAGVEFAEKWISVDEQLPDIDKNDLSQQNISERVLVITNFSEKPYLGRFHYNEMFWIIEGVWNVIVIKWRPITHK